MNIKEELTTATGKTIMLFWLLFFVSVLFFSASIYRNAISFNPEVRNDERIEK